MNKLQPRPTNEVTARPSAQKDVRIAITDMDIFKGPYFNINRNLLMFIGLWSYKIDSSKIRRIFWAGLLFLACIPHLLAAILHFEDADRMMLGSLVFLGGMVMVLKITALTVAENKINRMYANIADNYQTIQDENERAILIDYSERGRMFTILYTVPMLFFGFLITLVPIVPKILDIIHPLKEPRPAIYCLFGELFIDRDAHQTLVFLCDAMVLVPVTVITVAVDAMYIATAEHCCALNTIISYRLKSLGQKPSDGSLINDDVSYNKLISIFKLHQKTLSLTSMMNDSYSLMFLLIMTVNIVIVPLDACAIIASINDPPQLCLYATGFVAITYHLFTVFWPGQRIVDHNHRLCDDAYCNEWYTLSLRTKKLLVFFMLRCKEPASLSAGGLFFINFETYSMVMRTAISYITVLASFR